MSSAKKSDVPRAVVIVLTRGMGRHREVLLLRRAEKRRTNPGLWETISGRVEPGEEPAMAAQREMREESGIDTCVMTNNPTDRYHFERAGVPMEVLVYAAVAKGKPTVVLSDEHDDFAWCSIDHPNRAAALKALEARGVPARLVEAIDRSFVRRPER